MNRLIVLLCTFVFGCDVHLTTPDTDDANKLDLAIGGMPRTGLEVLQDYAMNRFAQHWLSESFDPEDEVAALTCHSEAKGGEVEIDELTLYVNQVLECLRGAKVPSYAACVGGVMADRLYYAQEQSSELPNGEEKYGRLSNCYYRVGKKFNHINAPKQVSDPDSWRSSDLSRVLIALSALELSRMPSLMSALGVSSIGAVLVAAPEGLWLLLCPLSDAVVCPDDPGAPGVSQHGAGGAGDR